MKLDKIKFASLVGFISYRYGLTITQDDMREMDELIDIEQPEQERVYPCNSHIDDLMRLMVAGTHKIEAIKVHRAITGYGLKESKDAVDKYWKVKPSKEDINDAIRDYMGHAPAVSSINMDLLAEHIAAKVLR